MQDTTLTIGIDYAETAKSIMAELAIVAAGRPEENKLPFANCRMKELAESKAKEACNSLCAMLSGYISEAKPDTGGIYTIELRLPCHITPAARHSLSARIGEAITLMVMVKIFSGSQQFYDELHKYKLHSDRAISSLRQLLAPR